MKNRFLLFLLCAAGQLSGPALAQTDNSFRYQAIVQRNVFGLQGASMSLLPGVPAASEPTQDLLLTGLVDFDSRRCAMFTVVEPGKPDVHFTLREGEQNDWLEIRQIDLKAGAVKSLLKKPVVRMRSVGAEVLLSFLPPQRGK